MIQVELYIVNNRNWPETNQLANYKRGQGFELEATLKQIQVVVTAELTVHYLDLLHGC